MKLSQFLKTANIIQQRESLSHWWSKGIFITIAASIFISSFFLNNRIRYTETNVVSVEIQPLLLPILIGVIVIALYLSAMLVVNIAREREKGTLEILLIGPVNERVYLAGMFYAYFKLFAIAISVFFAWTLASIFILNMPFKLEIAGIFMASILFAAEMNALGSLIVSIGKKPRHALIAFILVLLFLGAVHLTDELVSQYALSTSAVVTDPLIVIRNILMKTNQVFSAVSPFAHYYRGVQELLNGNLAGTIWKFVQMSGQAVVLLAAGTIVLRKNRGRE
jgi:ABC-type multidrug transport system permease subunit